MQPLYSSLDRLIFAAQQTFVSMNSAVLYGFVVEQLASRDWEWKNGDFSPPEVWRVSCFHNTEEYIIAIRETRFYPTKGHDDLFSLGMGVSKIEHNSMSEEDMLLLRLI